MFIKKTVAAYKAYRSRTGCLLSMNQIVGIGDFALYLKRKTLGRKVVLNEFKLLANQCKYKHIHPFRALGSRWEWCFQEFLDAGIPVWASKIRTQIKAKPI